MAALATVSYAKPDDSLQQATACMLNVLNTTPHAQSAALLVENGSPVLEYEYPDHSGHLNTVRFGVVGTYKNTASFMAVIPGLFDGNTPPSDLRTGRIIREWESRCGVSANALFE